MNRIIITAGATRNPIDAIRYLSAHATGTTGTELLNRLLSWQDVDFLGSAEAILRIPKNAAYSVNAVEFQGTRDLMSKMERLVPHATVVVHSAAVGDYEMAQVVDTKIPSNQEEITLRLTPTPKILDRVRAWNPTCYLVSFKAAAPGTLVEQLEDIARKQLQRTGSDLVFANVIGDTEKVLLVGGTETESVSRSLALIKLASWVQQKHGDRDTRVWG